MQSETFGDKISSQSLTFTLPLECHYCLHIPDNTPKLLILALHGYGMNADTMLDLTMLVTGRDRLVASIQAPHHFYVPDPRSQKVGYSWGTRKHGTASIRFHHQMIRHVRRELEERFGLGPSRTVLLGFSQPVGFNYRFAATFSDEVAGVIGICGGVPKDWETGDYGRVSASLLHVARDQDEVFGPDVTSDYERKLRTRADDVEFHLLAGGHRFPSKGAAVVEPWLAKRFGV